MADNTLAVFENNKIRRHYDEQMEIWYFSVVDIIQVLIQQPDYQAARVLKNRLKKEGSESVTKCNRLKDERILIDIIRVYLCLSVVKLMSCLR